MTLLKKSCYLLLFITMALACKEKSPTTNNANSNDKPVGVTTPGTPDTNIAVKDDFTLLTKADEEKEDKSHMDISYFPSNYALDKALNKPVELKVRVIYSRPHKGNRAKIFGTDSTLLVPYGKLWRLGANETTEIEFFKPVTIEGKKLNAGRYSMYAIPEQNSWTIIFNSDVFTFGSFNYNPAKDMLKAQAKVMPSKFSLETFLIYFQKTNLGCNMILSWDDVIVSLPIQLN